jgi:hypothetical protein
MMIMTTKNDELFLKTENIMQEVLRALYNGAKISAELEQLILDCVDVCIDGCPPSSSEGCGSDLTCVNPNQPKGLS